MNTNFAAIAAALEKTLSRDGTGPNQMESVLDMNSNRIINLPAPVDPSDPVRLQDLDDFGSGGGVIDAEARATANAALAASTANTTALAGKANTVHNHNAAAITDFNEAVDDRVNDLIVAGSGISKTYNDASGTLTLSATGGGGGSGSGDVVGPASSVDGRLALFDGTTGKLLKQHSAGVAGFAAASHTHVIGDVTGLQTALDDKAGAVHTHSIAAVTGLQTALDGKAALSHTHTASQVTDFSEAVDDRVAALVVAGTGISTTYNDGANTLTISATATGDAITPEQYGAVGDGTTNDATALQAAIDAALAQSKPLHLLKKYRCNSTLNVSGNDLAIKGTTSKEATIIFGSNAQLSIVGGSPSDYTGFSFHLEDFKIRTVGAHASPVIRASYTANGLGRTQAQMSFENIDISGASADDHFGTGIHLTNVQNVAFTECRIDGGDGGFVGSPATWLSGKGILIDGNDNPTEIKMWDVRVYNVNDGITVNGTTEGVYLNNILVISAQRGIVYDVGGEPLLILSNSHINTYKAGIDAVNNFQNQITGNLFYSFGTEVYTGIKIRSGVGPTVAWTIVANNFLGFGTITNKTAIDIDGISAGSPGGNKNTVIESNHFENFNLATKLGAYASFVQVGPTNSYVNVTTKVTNSGPGNIIHYPIHRQQDNQNALLIGTDNTVTDSFIGTNFSPDETGAKDLGNVALYWRNMYGQHLFGNRATFDQNTSNASQNVVGMNAAHGGQFLVTDNSTNPVYIRAGGNFRQVTTANIGGFDCLVLI